MYTKSNIVSAFIRSDTSGYESYTVQLITSCKWFLRWSYTLNCYFPKGERCNLKHFPNHIRKLEKRKYFQTLEISLNLSLHGVKPWIFPKEIVLLYCLANYCSIRKKTLHLIFSTPKTLLILFQMNLFKIFCACIISINLWCEPKRWVLFTTGRIVLLNSAPTCFQSSVKKREIHTLCVQLNFF